jgi:hypothetical protein
MDLRVIVQKISFLGEAVMCALCRGEGWLYDRRRLTVTG